MEDFGSAPKINFVPCVQWVRRGVAKQNPDKIELTAEELETVIQQTKTEVDDAEDDEAAQSNSHENDNDSKEDEFDFAHYDDEDNTALNVGNFIVSAGTSKDPYTILDDKDDDDSERDDDMILPNDNLILVGHVEGDAPSLEVYVYNEEEGSLYVHHDVLLPSFPLCIEWLGHEPLSGGASGNCCAVGTMSPIIEIWDMDLVNCIEAVCKLGKKKNKKKGIKSIGHKDAVLDLSWNINFPHILASGSVDQTVLLWDLDSCLPASKLKSFDEKVQTLTWHPFESQTLLTGCCDGGARVFDCRSEDSFKLWKVDGEVERVLWNHFNPFHFIVSTNTGKMLCVDCRSDVPVWEVDAHSQGVTGLSMSTQCPGLLTSASTDGEVKIWDIKGHETWELNSPKLVSEKNLGIGTVHCLEGNPNSPFVFCAGGDSRNKNFKVWDLRYNNEAVKHHFSSRELLATEIVKSEADEKPFKSEPMDTTSEATDALQSLSLKGRQKKIKNKKIVKHEKNSVFWRHNY